MNARSVSASIAILLGSLALPAVSQTIVGTVYDPSGAVVAKAPVKATNVETGFSAKTQAGEAGEFELLLPNAGRYRLEVEQPGFVAYSEMVKLEPGGSARVFALLRLGSIRERLSIASQGIPSALPPQRVRVGGSVTPARLVKRVNPAYPKAAKEAGSAGTVLLRAVILMDGSLGNITVLNAAPSELAAAAVEAASQWRYQPTLMNGKPVETETVIEMTYQLIP